ncbi:MAG: type II toxin-antitoxin system RelE/ParE family toxin [Lachnospiraceae bacterium]|nr:type II toxin-antitoxin system RelE/ParE family toxin [Lachnospiraceae bacterium]
MGYELMVTERAEELLDSLIYYILFELENQPAALRLLDGIQKIYCRLELNPLQFPVSCDGYLSGKGYHEAIVPGMNYMVVFDIDGQTVIILGIFHRLENFRIRLL